MSNNANDLSKRLCVLGLEDSFDFNKKLYIVHKVFYLENHKEYRGTVEIPFSSITGIEIHKPFLTRCGIIKFIIDGKRYIQFDTTKTLEDFLFRMSAFKENFPLLMEVVERIQKANPDCVVKVCKGLRLAFDVPVVKYKGEYMADKYVYDDYAPKKVDNTPYKPPKVYTDYESPTKKESSVIGSAIVGGVVAGPAGAVVGALHAVNKNNKSK